MPSAEELDLSAVPLFPLPGVVLFPHAVLPLHIFEDRYRAMTADALAGDRLVAMALLRPGWEKHYYGRAEIEPVVCVGRILSHEKLPDGKYNFLLEGAARCRLVREHPQRQGRAYRAAELAVLEEVPAMEIDLMAARQRLAAVFAPASPLASLGGGRQFREILRGHLSTPAIADLAAYTFLDDVRLKQSLLEEIDVRRRVERATAALEQAVAAMTDKKGDAVIHTRGDPSMN